MIDLVGVLLAGSYVISVSALSTAVVFQIKGRRRLENEMAGVQDQLDQLRTSCELDRSAAQQVQQRINELDKQLTAASGAPEKSWSNINRRTQVLRMLRSGQSAGRIAGELKMTRGEVDLIQRVQSIVSGSYDSKAAEDQFSDAARSSFTAGA